MYVEKNMKRFKNFLAEGYTLSLDKWKEKFGADFSDDVISVLDSIQPLVTTFNFEEKIKGKVKPIIKGKISGLEIDDLMLKISVLPDGWNKKWNNKKDHIWLENEYVKIDIQYGSGSGGSSTGSVEGGDIVPSQSDAYEMGFCVALNYKKKNPSGSLADLNNLEEDQLDQYLEMSGIDEKDKYWKSRKILNPVGWSSISVLNGLNSSKLLKHSGKLSTAPVSSWQKLPNGMTGGSDGTWKADIFFADGEGISIKDESGGQLASGLLGETLAALHMANEDYGIFYPDDVTMKNLADSIREQVSEKMNSGPLDIKKNITRTEKPVIDYILQKFSSGESVKELWALDKYGTKDKLKSKRGNPVYMWDKKSIEDFAKAITKVITTGHSRSTKWKTEADGASQAQAYANQIEQEYVEISRIGIAKTSLSDIQKVIDQKRLHADINEAGQKLFSSSLWKQFLVFETASGYRKWVDDPSESKFKGVYNKGIGSISKKEVAGYILQFSKKNPNSTGKLIPIDSTFCLNKAKTVRVSATFKTSGTTSPSLRVMHHSPFEKGCQMIVEQEFEKMESEFLTEGIIGNTLKNLGKKVLSTITNILNRIFKFIDGIFKKGFNFVLQSFGFRITKATVTGL